MPVSRGSQGLRVRLSALIYPLSGGLGSSCWDGFLVFPLTPAPPWLGSRNGSDLVLCKAPISRISRAGSRTSLHMAP